MEGVSFSEMSVGIYQTAQWCNLEDSHLHARMLFTLVVTEDCMCYLHRLLHHQVKGGRSRKIPAGQMILIPLQVRRYYYTDIPFKM
jgi:hypothetical protein